MPLLPQPGFSLEPVAAQVYQVSEMERELSDDLAGEHEELKKQVETERVELLKVRANLEMECERRLQEARSLAESVQESQKRALAAEQAATQRSKDATAEIQGLQERLREAEVLSTRTKLFEIIFRAIEEYCKRILTRRKLQKLLEGLCVFNAPSLQTAEKQGEIRVSEAQASLLKELEDWKEQCSRLQAEKDTNLAAEARSKALLEAFECEDMERLKADQEKLQSVEMASLSLCQSVEQEHQAVLQDMERVRMNGSRFDWPQAVRFCVRQDRTLKDVCLMEFHLSGRGADHQRITQEKEEEARLRQEAQRKHAEVQKDMNKVKEDQRRLQTDKDAEERAKLEVQRLHQAVLDEKNSLHGDHGHLQELLSAEQKAKEEVQRKHAQVRLTDKRTASEEDWRLTSLQAREEQLRMEAERKHQQLTADMEKLRQDQAKLQADKEDEKRAKDEAERKHAAVLRDMQQLQADQNKLQADHAAEKRAKEEAEKKHQEVLEDRDRISGDMRQLQNDKDAEQRAKQEMERKHEAALKQLELVNADQAKLKLDKDSELQARLDMEAKHQALLQDLEQVRYEKDQLHGQHQGSRTQLVSASCGKE
ncbi:unnamed protein product [Durusdinium trenchii]|uniref:Uncharacterized protein n=1 Tax=Durusdinium trenchii TaxID=1381693 RepID=A0ABP0MXE9_9DINO